MFIITEPECIVSIYIKRMASNGMSARPASTRRLNTGTGTGAGVPPLRPGSRANIRVPDRPVTQQGLTGLRTAAKGLGPERSVQDRTYYLGLLRGKTQELSLEKAKITRELDAYEEDNANYILYEQRAQQLAAEIAGLRGDMNDYNLLIERVGTGAGTEDLEQESEAVRMENRREALIVEQVFSERQGKEEEARECEQQLLQERQRTERVVEQLEETEQDKYRETRREIESTQLSIEQQQEELLKARRLVQRYEEEIYNSDVKTEAVRLLTQLRELERKRSELQRESEERSKLTPEEEREQLLQQVKQDNQEIALLQERLSRTQDQAQAMQADINQVDRDMEEANSEKHQKYQEMKKKEGDMKQFMDGFEEAWSVESEKRSNIEQNIVNLLQEVSRIMTSSKQLPSLEEYEQLQADLEHKKFEKDKSEATAKSLELDNVRLQSDLDKVNQLEDKLGVELGELKEKVDTLTSEIQIYSDFNALEQSETEKRIRLGEEKQILTLQREQFKSLVTRTTEKYESAKLLLNDNETYVQLCNLERKWQHHLQSNFAMEEFISNKTKETDYQPIARNVCLHLRKYNSMLIKNIPGVGK